MYFNDIEKKLGSFNSHVGYEISRSHSPKEFFIALAIELLLKSNTDIALSWTALQMSHIGQHLHAG